MNPSNLCSAFPFVQSEALPGPGPSGAPGGSVDALPSLSSAGCEGPGFSPDRATPGVGFSQELYAYSLGEIEGTIARDGSTSGDASGWRGFAIVAVRDILAGRMSVAIRNTGGSWLRLGLFDASGNLLGRTARFAPVSNTILTVPFESSVQLYGGSSYYLAYWSDDTTGNIQFSLLSGRSTSNRTPLMQRNDPNENTATISASFTFTSYRPWLMIGE